MIPTIDGASAICEFLKTSTEPLVLAVQNLVVGGSDGILEAGDVTPEVLKSQESARFLATPADGSYSQVLAISMTDGGEEVIDDETVLQHVVIRAYDRKCSNRNIRTVRTALKKVLHHTSVHLSTDQGVLQGMLDLVYAGSLGHRFDTTFGVEYDVFNFVATVVQRLPENS